MYPKSLAMLIERLTILPGVGQKTAERYALHLLDQSKEANEELAQAILNAKTKVHPCERCSHFAENELCDICADKSRQSRIICVVESPKDVIAIERIEEYKGVYHVLGGLISTKKGILPEDISLDKLFKRAKDCDELILALNATVEGEMTALYIAKKLQGQVPITRLAFGLPIGGQLDYADDMTLLKAFEGRKSV